MSICACESRLAQTAGAAKSNAITDIPKVPDLGGTTGTTDAIGCRKDLVKHIRLQQADYVLTVKDRQSTLRLHWM